jgi:hypothetical protein
MRAFADIDTLGPNCNSQSMEPQFLRNINQTRSSKYGHNSWKSQEKIVINLIRGRMWVLEEP